MGVITREQGLVQRRLPLQPLAQRRQPRLLERQLAPLGGRLCLAPARLVARTLDGLLGEGEGGEG